MYRLLLGLGSLVLVVVWSGAVPVHAVSPDVISITVEGVITEVTDIEQIGIEQTVSLTVTNNTTDFRMKGFAVTVGTAILGSATADPIWEATVTNTKPTGLEELEGSGGARLDLREYVFYQAFVAGDYLPPHGSDNSFTFKRFVLPGRDVPPGTPLDPLPVGILVVDQDDVEFACFTTVGSDGCSPTIRETPPDCSTAVASVSTLWPPNHTFVPINIVGVTTSYESPVSITIDSISQDEPVQKSGTGSGKWTMGDFHSVYDVVSSLHALLSSLTCPDGRGVETDTAQVRAERAGKGNGRVYHIAFTADDGEDTCTGVVQVCVPHDQGRGKTCIDDGPLYDSTVCRSQRWRKGEHGESGD